MSKKDLLFSLIKSLNKHEKKHFRLFASTKGGEKKYLLLFDTISSMTVYDEDFLRKELSGEKFLKQLPVAKNYLNFLLLKFLRLHHSSSSTENRISEEIRNVEILYEKGLYQNARAILARTEKLAFENEKFLRHLEILNWKRKLDRITGYHTLSEEKLKAEEQTEELLLEKYRLIKKYDNLSDHFFIIAAKTNFPAGHSRQQQLQQLASNELLGGNPKELPYKGRYVYNLVNARLHHTFGNLEKSYLYGKAQIEAIESLPPSFFIEERYNYIIALYNQLIILNFLKRNNEFEKTLQKIRALKTRNNKEAVAVFYSVLPELDFCLSNKHTANVFNIEKEVLRGFSEFSSRINKQIELGLFYSLACLFLWANQPRKAISWINRILNNTELDVRTDIYCMARLINLLLHYELKNFDLLISLARSADRYLKKHDVFGEVEELFLRCFGQLIPSAQSQRARIQILQHLDVEISALSSGKENHPLFSMFDFNEWLKKTSQINYK